MFRLEDEVSRWRSAYENDLAFSEEDIIELESHLRSSIENKVQEGLTEGEAFKAAVSSLGDRKRLRKEYKKAKSAHWFAFSVLRGLYLICGTLAFVIALVFKFTTDHVPSFLYSRNVFDGLDAFTLVAWWLPAITVLTALLLIKNKTVRLVAIGVALFASIGFVMSPYQITSFIYDADSLFRTSYLILVTSLFFRELWGWRITMVVTGSYFLLVSLTVLPHLVGIAGLSLPTIFFVMIASMRDPIIGLLLRYALFKQQQPSSLERELAS